MGQKEATEQHQPVPSSSQPLGDTGSVRTHTWQLEHAAALEEQPYGTTASPSGAAQQTPCLAKEKLSVALPPKRACSGTGGPGRLVPRQGVQVRQQQRPAADEVQAGHADHTGRVGPIAWWGTRKQLVVFFAEAGIGTRGGWGAKAVLQACRKVVERPNSGGPIDRVKGKVVTVDEFRTSRVSSAMNSPQPCEEELDRSKPTRPEGWKPQPVIGLNLIVAWSASAMPFTSVSASHRCQWLQWADGSGDDGIELRHTDTARHRWATALVLAFWLIFKRSAEALGMASL
ncbi:hypothetical protein QJQ45_004032 [Haematococcus lacustris]|nr:hypothetical protein QJQ45_004032 [Haematococcus lacustris]